MPLEKRHASSFRDPGGFLFRKETTLYRQINQSYRADYDLLLASGLYDELIAVQMLIPHRESDIAPANPALAYKIIEPDQLSFISYPYEWSFSQLQDAALVTLEIQQRSLQKGLWLKDASGYNIQFHQGRPLLIDTLSFERYRQGEPWAAYRQFCQHFLAPLALMAYTDVRLGQLLRVYIDGVPLDLAAGLLPRRTRLSFGLLNHIHMHAAAQKRYAGRRIPAGQAGRKMSLTALKGWVDSLRTTIEKLRWDADHTAWAGYYGETNYSDLARRNKEELVVRLLAQVDARTVWDLGANTGRYSRLASSRGIFTVAFDIDPGAVERNYQQVRTNGETQLLPLLLDLTNPSPGLGWHNQERSAIFERGRPDCVLALALIHHLAIANNVPLPALAQFFQSLSSWLIIEFVPKSDSQVQRLLASRQDIFTDYTRSGFESAFLPFFDIVAGEQIAESDRFLYLLRSTR